MKGREFEIIGFIEKNFSKQADARLLLGPGDDAAVVKSGGKRLVATTDEMVEGTHFRDGLKYPAQIARKLLRINLSDLAAMGNVKPLFCLAGGGFPREFPASWIRKFTRALAGECVKFGLSLAGGNLARSDCLHVYAAVVGEAKGRILVRSSAKPGDWIFNVGPLGESGIGLGVFLGGRAPSVAGKRMLKSFWLPEPMFREASIVARHFGGAAMMDNSDGLLRSCEYISKSSGVKIRITLGEESLPRRMRDYCRANGMNALECALSGGEDYGLLFSVPAEKAGEVARLLPSAFKVGEVLDGKGVEIDGNENKIGVFEHF